MSSTASHRAERIVLLAGLALPSLLTWLYFVALQGQARELQQAVYAVGKSIQFALPLVALWLVRRRPTPVSPVAGVAAVTRLRGIFEGVAFGAVVFALMVAGYHFWVGPAQLLSTAGEAIRTKVADFGVDSPAKFVLLGVFYSAVHSFLEEYYWRWFVFGRLREIVAIKWAIAISSIAFAAHHVIVLAFYFGWMAWPTWLFSAAVAVGGAVWAWSYHRSRSLVGPWLGHLLIDAAIFAIGYQLVFG